MVLPSLHSTAAHPPIGTHAQRLLQVLVRLISTSQSELIIFNAINKVHRFLRLTALSVKLRTVESVLYEGAWSHVTQKLPAFSAQLRAADVAELLGLKPATLRYRLKHGLYPFEFRRDGLGYLFTEDDVSKLQGAH
jgi:hypothetical protein